MRRHSGIGSAGAMLIFGLLLADPAASQEPTIDESAPVIQSDAGIPEESGIVVSEDSPGSVEITGVAETRFNPRLGTLFFRIHGARLTARIQDIVVLVNNQRVSDDTLAVSPHMVALSYALESGLNEISLIAYDTQRLVLSADAVLWAGTEVLTVDVVDDSQSPVSGVEVTVALANARSVKASGISVDGVVRFEHVPAESIAIEAVHPDGRRARATVPGNTGSALLQLPR